jgi:hypothetical protein
VKEGLAKSEMGALLCFDMNNVRYITSTNIGSWAQDKVSRFTLLPQNDEPILWDFGSAARHHQLNCPWLGERSRAGISLLRGAMSPEMGRAEMWRGKSRRARDEGLHESRSASPSPAAGAVCLAAEAFGGRRAAEIVRRAGDRARTEIALLNTSAMMVDAAYHERHGDETAACAGEAVGLVSRCCTILDPKVEAESRRRCSAPARFSDRVLRPSVPFTTNPPTPVHGYRVLLPVLRDRVSARARGRLQALPVLDAAIDRPGRDAEIAPCGRRQEFPKRRATRSSGHGGLAIWEKPVIAGSSRSIISTRSSRHGLRARAFPSVHRWMARRAHEEEIVVTPTGHEITRFRPNSCSSPYYVVTGPSTTTRTRPSSSRRGVCDRGKRQSEGRASG